MGLGESGNKEDEETMKHIGMRSADREVSEQDTTHIDFIETDGKLSKQLFGVNSIK